MRFALLVLLLVLSPAWAQDDEGLLDTPALGEGIPERMQELEREWAEDTGVKEPVDERPDEPDAVAEPADAAHEDEAEPAKTPAVDEPQPEPPSSIRKPAPDGARRTPADAAKNAPSRAERRATSEE